MLSGATGQAGGVRGPTGRVSGPSAALAVRIASLAWKASSTRRASGAVSLFFSARDGWAYMAAPFIRFLRQPNRPVAKSGRAISNRPAELGCLLTPKTERPPPRGGLSEVRSGALIRLRSRRRSLVSYASRADPARRGRRRRVGGLQEAGWGPVHRRSAGQFVFRPPCHRNLHRHPAKNL